MAKPVHTYQNGKVVVYNSDAHKFGAHWVSSFMKRHGLSVQKRTNKKPENAYLRQHQVENYHYYAIYLCALQPPGEVGERGHEFGRVIEELDIEDVDRIHSVDFLNQVETDDSGIDSNVEDSDGWD